MRLDRVDLNLFVVFEALYRERSVTKTAAALNLTQPGVSNALSRLRQAFDDPLFIRSPDGMVPTPVADSVVGDVRRALALLHKSFSVNARFDPATAEKVVRLAMNDLVEMLLLPPLQRLLKQQAPLMTISSYYADSRSATEDLKANTIDLLLDSPQVNAKELVSELLLELPYVVVMRDDHPLLQQALTQERYLKADHLHVSSRRRGRGQVDIALHGIGKRRQINMRVRTYMLAVSLIQRTDLLWTVPKCLADTLSLTQCEVPFAVEPLRLYMYWQKSADDDPASQWIRHLVKNVLADVV